jgi:hypothetical protein
VSFLHPIKSLRDYPLRVLSPTGILLGARKAPAFSNKPFRLHHEIPPEDLAVRNLMMQTESHDAGPPKAFYLSFIKVTVKEAMLCLDDFSFLNVYIINIYIQEKKRKKKKKKEKKRKEKKRKEKKSHRGAAS